MKIVIPGGHGQAGTVLAGAFMADGHHVLGLSRKSQISPERTVLWDGEMLGTMEQRSRWGSFRCWKVGGL